MLLEGAIQFYINIYFDFSVFQRRWPRRSVRVDWKQHYLLEPQGIIFQTNKNTRKISRGNFFRLDHAFSVKISCSAQSAGNWFLPSSLPRKRQSILVHDQKPGSSETIRVASFNFNQWLAGLIDGDGYFGISQAGYVSCEVTLHEDEVQALYKIQKECGGKIHSRKGVKAYRWRLHNISDMRDLIKRVNGLIRLPIRYKQLGKVCDRLQIKSQPVNENLLTPDNSWLVGFFDAEGHIRINPLNKQVQLTLAQKDRSLLDQIQKVWKGSIFFDKSWKGYVWVVSTLKELSPFVDYLFVQKLQIPQKQARLHTFKRYLLYQSLGTPADLQKMAGIIEHFRKIEVKK